MTDLRAALTFLFTASFIGSVFVTDPFSGFTADQLPVPQVDPPIQPAGYAFAIWGLIYAWLAVSAIFGLAVRTTDDGWERARLPLIGSLAIGTPWLWIANQSPIWATITIIAMAALAIWALLIAPKHDRWLFQAPVAIYAGWLTAASCVSLGTTLAGYDIGMDQIGWAYAGIGAALLITLTIQNRAKPAPEYGATVCWALIGVIIANLNIGAPLDSAHLGIAIAAAVGITVICLTLARNAAKARPA